MIFNHVYGGLKINGNQYQFSVSEGADVSKGDFVSILSTGELNKTESVSDPGVLANDSVIGSPTSGSCRQCKGVELEEGKILVVFVGDDAIYGLILTTTDSGKTFGIASGIVKLASVASLYNLLDVYITDTGTVYVIYTTYSNNTSTIKYVDVTVAGITMSAGGQAELYSHSHGSSGGAVDTANESEDSLFCVLTDHADHLTYGILIDKTGAPFVKINKTLLDSNVSQCVRCVFRWKDRGILLVSSTASVDKGRVVVVTFSDSSMSAKNYSSPVYIHTNWSSAIMLNDRFIILGGRDDHNEMSSGTLKDVPYVELFIDGNSISFGAVKQYSTRFGLPWLYRRSRIHGASSCLTMWQHWDKATSPSYSISASEFTLDTSDNLVMSETLGIAQSTLTYKIADEHNYCFNTSFGSMYVHVMYSTDGEYTSNNVLRGYVIERSSAERKVFPYQQGSTQFGVAKNSGSAGDVITIVSPITIEL